MKPEELLTKTVADHKAAIEKFQDACGETLLEIADRTIEALRQGGKICFFGNGGSAADAQHFAAEFVVRFVREREAFAGMAFTTDTSILTACANDFTYDEVFARQVEGLCTEKDVVVGISTSGTSKNVVRGLEAARKMGATTVAFTGENGATCAEIADLTLAAPSPITARVQECHLLAGHILCDLAEEALS